MKRSELRFEAWKRVRNGEGAVYTPVPRKLIGRLPKHWNIIILNFHRFWIGWWNKNIPYLAEKASNRPLKFSIFTCNPMGGLFSVVPPLLRYRQLWTITDFRVIFHFHDINQSINQSPCHLSFSWHQSINQSIDRSFISIHGEYKI